MATINRQWRLVRHPSGEIRHNDIRLFKEPAPEPVGEQLLVRNLYLSLDPANRIWITEEENHIPRVPLGQVLRGLTVGVVEKSRHLDFREGDLVQGVQGWQDFELSDGSNLTRIPPDRSVPLTGYLGLFGPIGLTAYFGLLDVGNPQPNETVVVSAASDLVGAFAGQIGKIKGCRVVGIAHSDAKCRWVTEELGFDAAINYETDPVHEALEQECPEGIDIDFESVGGEILDKILAHVNERARIVLCGLIPSYNPSSGQSDAKRVLPGPTHLGQVICKRARMEGFVVLDYLDRAEEALRELKEWYSQGRLRYQVDRVRGLENVPAALDKLLDGSNRGKLIIQIADEPVV